MNRPVIAVAGFVKPVPIGPRTEEALVLPVRYLDAVRIGGGEPVVLPYGEPRTVDGFAGLVLAGGGDLDPAAYGQGRAPQTGGVDVRRDAAEFALARRAVEAGIPVLAICRGAQLVNVALGGTLIQHLDGQAHQQQDGTGFVHTVDADPQSFVGRACGRTFEAWSSHHQAIDRLADGLRPVAWAPDGVVEAVESTSGRVVAVQWHPERTAAESEPQASLFRAFVRACSTA